ncbi:MAG: ABC transporter substrate-binding protein [Alphaproteobacteria bacterium]
MKGLTIHAFVAAASLILNTAVFAATQACSPSAMSKRDYGGRPLRILVHEKPVMGEPMALNAERFAALTGADLSVTHVPFGDLYQEMMVPFLLGEDAYDVVVYGSLWIGDVAPYIAPVPARFLETPELRSVTPTYRQIASWDGRMIQFPIDGDRHYLKYRKDALENPDYQARFQKVYGRSLTVPTTWQEYEEVARFFSGWDWDGDGALEYGAAEYTSVAGMMVFSSFMSRAAPYAKHPDVPGGFFFDLETMEPLIDTPGFVRALEDMVRARQYWPPNGDQFTVVDEIESFGGGQTALSFTYDDSTARAMEPGSPIAGEMGFAPPPGSREVWNRRTGQWDHFAEPNVVPYIAWGWTSAVAASSPNRDMAFDYLCFFITDENHNHDLGIGRFGVNPFRSSDFSWAYYHRQAGWPEAAARDYAAALAFVDGAPHKVLDLRTPGVNQFMEALVTGISAALHDGVAPKEALERVAADWRNIANEIGIEEVRAAYRSVVAVEDGIPPTN